MLSRCEGSFLKPMKGRRELVSSNTHTRIQQHLKEQMKEET